MQEIVKRPSLPQGPNPYLELYSPEGSDRAWGKLRQVKENIFAGFLVFAPDEFKLVSDQARSAFGMLPEPWPASFGLLPSQYCNCPGHHITSYEWPIMDGVFVYIGRCRYKHTFRGSLMFRPATFSDGFPVSPQMIDQTHAEATNGDPLSLFVNEDRGLFTLDYEWAVAQRRTLLSKAIAEIEEIVDAGLEPVYAGRYRI